MLLVNIARQVGLELSVANVFKYPKLCDLAVTVKRNSPEAKFRSKSHLPCLLFNVTDHEAFIREIATGQTFQPTDVVDVLSHDRIPKRVPLPESAPLFHGHDSRANPPESPEGCDKGAD